MKNLGMIAIAVALGAPALALAQPAGRSAAVPRDVARTITPTRDVVRVRPDVGRVDRADPSLRRRAYEPNRRLLVDPNRRRFNHHARRRWNAANPPGHARRRWNAAN